MKIALIIALIVAVVIGIIVYGLREIERLH